MRSKKIFSQALCVAISEEQNQDIINSGLSKTEYTRLAIENFRELRSSKEETLIKEIEDLKKSLEVKNKQLELIRKRDITKDKEFREKYELAKPSIQKNIRFDGLENTIKNSLFMNSKSNYLGITIQQLKDLIIKDFPETT